MSNNVSETKIYTNEYPTKSSVVKDSEMLAILTIWPNNYSKQFFFPTNVKHYSQSE